MTAQLIDGTAIAATIRAEIQSEVEALREAAGIVPGLATVLVGQRKDSQTYVRMKKRACEEVGIASFGVELSAEISEADLLVEIEALNENPDVHGILVQLPLPAHIDEEQILGSISVHKDVDGFHPVNIGRLAMKGRAPGFVPCTPRGCIELLERSGIEIAGRHAVVLGRSNIVGLPVAMLLLHRNATLTVCPSRTADLPSVVRSADILVAAV